MVEQPILSQDEWALIVELLRNERSELPSEIRRTRAHQAHDDLHDRLKMVEHLLERLQGVPAH